MIGAKIKLKHYARKSLAQIIPLAVTTLYYGLILKLHSPPHSQILPEYRMQQLP